MVGLEQAFRAEAAAGAAPLLFFFLALLALLLVFHVFLLILLVLDIFLALGLVLSLVLALVLILVFVLIEERRQERCKKTYLSGPSSFLALRAGLLLSLPEPSAAIRWPLRAPAW